MAKVQKTISFEVKITIDMDELLVDEDIPSEIADGISFGLDHMNAAHELAPDCDVKEYNVHVLNVEDTNYTY